MKMNKKVFAVLIIILFVVFIINDKTDKPSLFNNYLNDDIYFLRSLKFDAKFVLPIDGKVKYNRIWIETEETYKELERWNEKIKLLKSQIENGIVIYTPKMNNTYILEFMEMDEKCEFFMLGDIEDNQIQIINLEYVSLNDIYEKIEEVKIYRHFIELVE